MSQYDAASGNIGEVLLSSVTRDGQALNDPASIQTASLSAIFVRPNGDEIEHDSIVDVTITIAPAAE
jgi:hypothetical protein